jgi:hypothetical protein
MLIIFFDIKRIVHKEFVLASQPVNSILRPLRENVRRLRPELRRPKELAVASRQRAVSNFLLHHGIFNQNQHDCRVVHFQNTPVFIQ